MSTTHHTNGTITLRSLADLGKVLDPSTLPDAPQVGPIADSEAVSNAQPMASASTLAELQGIVDTAKFLLSAEKKNLIG